MTAERACMEMNRIEELLATTKLNDMMHKKDDDQKTTVLWILAIIGAVAAVLSVISLKMKVLWSRSWMNLKIWMD